MKETQETFEPITMHAPNFNPRIKERSVKNYSWINEY